MTLQQYLAFVNTVVNRAIKVPKEKALELFKKCKTNKGTELSRSDFNETMMRMAQYWTQLEIKRLNAEKLAIEKKEWYDLKNSSKAS